MGRETIGTTGYITRIGWRKRTAGDRPKFRELSAHLARLC